MSAGINWSNELYGNTTGVDLSNSIIVDLTATTHNLDWDTGSITPQMIEFTTDGVYNLTGMVAPEKSTPTYVMLWNPSPNRVVLINEGSNSEALNRFALPDNSDENIDPNEARLMVYMPEKGRWYNFVQAS